MTNTDRAVNAGDLERPAIDPTREVGHDLRVDIADVLKVDPESVHPDAQRRADA